MAKHFFGLKDGDFRGRFPQQFSEEEFEELVFVQLGGELPKGVFAWHLEDGETLENSKRVQAIAKLPIVTGPFGNWLNPKTHLPKMKAEQEAREAHKANQSK
ncbi:hypothetical protein NST99_07290 [Paenibacillus sp. FSL L8-0470]|uniref:hypothetical protein n=1 Tax=Paenibacillus sp. FSL L8-0470 TaxID=2954688 RepID=UPI0030FABC78